MLFVIIKSKGRLAYRKIGNLPDGLVFVRAAIFIKKKLFL